MNLMFLKQMYDHLEDLGRLNVYCSFPSHFSKLTATFNSYRTDGIRTALLGTPGTACVQGPLQSR